MLMNGTNGNEPGYPEKALVPYPVILAATNLTFSYIPKAGNEFGNCAFAATGRPYQGCYAASWNRKRYILDNIVLIVSESDAFQFNVILGYILILALHSGRG